MESEFHCYYHRDIETDSVCEKCGKFVCSECKPDKLCPECFYNSVVNKSPPKAVIYIVIFSIFYLFISIIMLRITIIGSKICFATLIVLLIGTIVVYGLKKIKQDEKAKQIRNKAISALPKIDLENTNVVSKSDEVIQIPLYCRLCGAPIKRNENTCQYCGMTWIWK